MKKTTCVLGLDIAAQKADWCLYSTTKNTIEAEGAIELSKFAEWLTTNQKTYTIKSAAAEYTGGLAAPFLRAITTAKIPAYIIQTVDRRSYKQLHGGSIKTDKEDARLIARTLAIWSSPEVKKGELMKKTLFQPWAQVETAWTLRNFIGDHQGALKMTMAAMARAKAADNTGRESQSIVWAKIEAQNRIYADQFWDIAMNHAKKYYAQEMELLQSVPHIGEKTAVFFLANLMPLERFEESSERPDRSKYDDKERMYSNINRYVGYIPRLEQSGGKTYRNSTYRAGCVELRAMLTIAALGAASPRGNNAATAFYKKQVKNGKEKKRAVYLTGKRILRWGVVVLRTKTPFIDPHKTPAKLSKAARMPEHLISQADAARILGISRARIGQIIETFAAEEFEGKKYLLRSSVEEQAKIRKEKTHRTGG